MREKIVVTGMGAVTPVGVGLTSYWENLVAGRCGIGRISAFDAGDLAVQIAGEVRDFHAEDYMPRKLIHETDAFTQYAFAAAREALAQAGGREAAGEREGRPDSGRQGREDGDFPAADGSGGPLPAPPDRCGIVMGTAMAGIDTIASTQEVLTNAVHKNVGPRFVPRILGNIAAAQIAIAYGITGPSLTLSTACASGGDAILTCAMQLLAGEADAMLAVGADSTLCPLVIYSLANARALSRENEHPEKACRPFDTEARGFVIGEGGGALVLETEDHARARGADILAELAGWANNNDAFHVTNPAEEGVYAARCMRRALDRARMSPDQIDYVNAHGTGAPKGDQNEAEAMMAVFRGCRPAVSSTKAATGHMMGGGGITEAIACIQAMRTGVIPPTLNLDHPVADLDFVTQTRREQEVRAAMTNAFGFGGQNSTVIFRRYQE